MSNSQLTASAPKRLTPQRAKQSLLRWWFIPLALAIIGAGLGYAVGGGTRPTAETIVSITNTQVDAGTLARVSETLVREIRTDAVFNEASRALGQDSNPQELRDRTRVSAVSSTSLISVQVTAATVEQAAEEADAVVAAVLKIEEDAREAELERVSAQIRALMTAASAKLSNTQAEAARVAQLGSALADAQAQVASNPIEIAVVQPARLLTATVGPTTLAVACGLGGLLVGSGIALLLGATRGRVRSFGDLAEIFPHVPAIAPTLLSDVLAVEGDQIDTILVSGTATSRERLTDLRDQIAVQLFAGSGGGRDLDVLAAPLSDAVVRRVSTDPGVVLVVGIDPKTARLEELGSWIDRLPSRAYLLELPEQS